MQTAFIWGRGAGGGQEGKHHRPNTTQSKKYTSPERNSAKFDSINSLLMASALLRRFCAAKMVPGSNGGWKKSASSLWVLQAAHFTSRRRVIFMYTQARTRLRPGGIAPDSPLCSLMGKHHALGGFLSVPCARHHIRPVDYNSMRGGGAWDVPILAWRQSLRCSGALASDGLFQSLGFPMIL